MNDSNDYCSWPGLTYLCHPSRAFFDQYSWLGSMGGIDVCKHWVTGRPEPWIFYRSLKRHDLRYKRRSSFSPVRFQAEVLPTILVFSYFAQFSGRFGTERFRFGSCQYNHAFNRRRRHNIWTNIAEDWVPPWPHWEVHGAVLCQKYVPVYR